MRAACEIHKESWIERHAQNIHARTAYQWWGQSKASAENALNFVEALWDRLEARGYVKPLGPVKGQEVGGDERD